MPKFLPSLIVSACLIGAVSSPAQSIYWGAGGGGAWATAANWFADADKTIPAGGIPTLSSDVIFNATPDNGVGGTITMSTGTIFANSLTFNTSAATILSQNGGNRHLFLGGGGITVNSGAGTASIGVSTLSLRVNLLESQTWTNNSSNALNVRLASAADSASGPVTLTLNAASTGSIVAALAYSDSPNSTNTLGIVVDSVGTGTVSMAAGTYSGGTLVKRGALAVSGNVGSGNVLVGDTSGTNSARLILTGSATNNITAQAGTSGTVSLLGGTGGDYAGTVTLNRDVIFGSAASSAQTIVYSGVISGSGGITVARGGSNNPTVIISGTSNTYTGKTVIDSATLAVNSLNSIAGGSASSSLGAPTTVADGTIVMSTFAASTLRYLGAGETTDRVIETASNQGATLEQAGTGTLKFTSNFVTSGSGARTITLRGATSGVGEIAGVISNGSGTAGITKTDTGTWRLSGTSSTYTGATALNGGVLEVTKLSNGGVASSIGAASVTSGNLSFNGGTLRYIGTGDSTNKNFNLGVNGATLDASGSGAVTFSGSMVHQTTGTARTITFAGVNTDANTFSGAITNTGAGALTSVVKDGVGKWVLSATNTYTGSTTISAGTLLVNGSLNAGSAVALNGGTLGGGGSVGGLVTTAGIGARISPGNSPGTLSLIGGLDATAGVTFVFELGTTSDLLSLGSGMLTGSAAAGGLVFNFSDAGGLVAGNPYTLITFGSATGLDYSDFSAAVLPAGYMLDTSFGTGGFQINGSSLEVQFSAVPEPSVVALLAGGLGVAAVTRRRRKV